jgi:nucleoside-diphosphate-sugar epimerase
VVGTRRRVTGPGERGVRLVGFDGEGRSVALAAEIAQATHVIVSVPPGVHGDPVLHHHGDDIRASTTIAWIGYLSTIGVYGDRDGGYVDETTPPAPTTERSRARLAAETEWLSLARPGGPSVGIFRLAGIYGPGRSAIDQVRAGTARRIIKSGQVFNRIHVDDIATILMSAIDRSCARPGGHTAIYNLADDEPSPPEDVIEHAARLLGAPMPPAIPFESADLSPMARSFYGEVKRVRNDKLKSELGVTLAYPTYREGLAAIVAGLS